MTRPVLIHVHIPKSAGTTVNSVLADAIGGRHFTCSAPEQAEKDLQAMLQADRDRIDFVFGHFPYGLHRLFTRPVRYIASVRDPRQRIFSFYQYVLASEDHPKHELVKKNSRDFASFLRLALNEARIRNEIDNVQVRMIAGDMRLRTDYGETLSRAVSNAVAGNFFIADVQRLDDLLKWLEQATRLELGPIPRLNASETGASFKEEMQRLGSRDHEALMSFTKWDSILHTIVRDMRPPAISSPDVPEDPPVAEFVRALYRVLLFREPDLTGFESYVQQIGRDRSIEDAIRQMLKSREFASKHERFSENYLPSGAAKRRDLASMDLNWAPDRIEQARRRAEQDEPPYSVLARADLEALSGNLGSAQSMVLEALEKWRDKWLNDQEYFNLLLQSLFVVQRLDVAAEILARKFEVDCCAIELKFGLDNPFSAVRCNVISRGLIQFEFDVAIVRAGRTTDLRWFGNAFPLFVSYMRNGAPALGSVMLNHEDIGRIPGLSYGGNRSDSFLVPDHAFVASRGYQHFFRCYEEHHIPWDARQPIAFWRGSSTGHTGGQVQDQSKTWRSLPRIKLCAAARSPAGRDLIDAGITNIVQVRDPEAVAEIQAAGLTSPRASLRDFIKYKYQIDIDGHTNSWPGLFQKLCTGSTVLKIASQFGYKQWYYDRLQPWVHFVPVKADMSDLLEKIRWLQGNDAVARKIGECGLLLARSLEFQAELDRASGTIAAAINYFAQRPEMQLRFGAGCGAETYLSGGWSHPEPGQVWAIGTESSISLPRPVAAEDFLLELTLTPHTHPPDVPHQRLSVIVNGDLLGQATIDGPHKLVFRLARHIIDRSEALRIMLLHPDAVSPAPYNRYPDTRRLSLALHELALTPVSNGRSEGEPASR